MQVLPGTLLGPKQVAPHNHAAAARNALYHRLVVRQVTPNYPLLRRSLPRVFACSVFGVSCKKTAFKLHETSSCTDLERKFETAVRASAVDSRKFAHMLYMATAKRRSRVHGGHALTAGVKSVVTVLRCDLQSYPPTRLLCSSPTNTSQMIQQDQDDATYHTAHTHTHPTIDPPRQVMAAGCCATPRKHSEKGIVRTEEQQFYPCARPRRWRGRSTLKGEEQIRREVALHLPARGAAVAPAPAPAV